MAEPGGAEETGDGIWDLVLLADMTRDGDIGLRIAQEIRTYAGLNYRTGLIHLPQRGGGRIAPDIQRCVREGLAEPLDPAGTINARLLLVYSPQSIPELPRLLRGLAADRAVLVLDQPPDFDPRIRERVFAYVAGPATWAPTNRWVREAIRARHPSGDVLAEDWLAIGDAAGVADPRPWPARPVVGRISATGASQWPASPIEVGQMLPGDGSVDVRVFGAPPAHLLPDQRLFPWTMFAAGSISLERLLRRLDAFVYFPGAGVPELPDAAIASALAAGKVVLLPPRLRLHYGDGPVYCEPGAVAAELRRLAGDEAARAAVAAAAVQGGRAFARARHVERIARLLGPPAERRPAVAAVIRARSAPPRRALFVTSNGIGLGHVTRLLAIARRAHGRFEPVFATMAHAAPVIEAFGYAAEYLPSQAATDGDLGAWDAWLRVELEEMIDAHQARLVVFDGNHPTPGLVEAVASRGDCRFAWVRRGMWGSAQSPHIGNAAYFDLVIEPGEIAGERDDGITARRRDEARLVRPIRLLDEHELLPRDEAAAALGLPPGRPAVLVQLGAGANRDVLGLAEKVVGEIRKHLEVEIVLAEWTNSANDLALWPGVRVVNGFPIGQYFHAFDLSIAAAGYNTFHDVISAGLPTIFMPNTGAGIDDQVGRARFAQEAGAAFELPEKRWFELPALVEVLLNPKARDYVRERCRALRQENGAAEAADLLGKLLEPAAARVAA